MQGRKYDKLSLLCDVYLPRRPIHHSVPGECSPLCNLARNLNPSILYLSSPTPNDDPLKETMSGYQVGDKVECKWALRKFMLMFSIRLCNLGYGARGGNNNSGTTGVIEGSMTLPQVKIISLMRDPFTTSSHRDVDVVMGSLAGSAKLAVIRDNVIATKNFMATMKVD